MKLLIALALCALLGCAAGQDGGAPPEQRFIGKPVQRTALTDVGTREVKLTAYTGNLLFATEFEFKCVEAGAGCDAPAAGTTVSGVFVKGKSEASGTVEGLEPETLYDCYVITNDKKCGKPFRVETEPVLFLGGSLYACDIVKQISQDDEGMFKPTPKIKDCRLNPTTAEDNNDDVDVPPNSIVVQDGKVTFTYGGGVLSVGVYGVQTCTLTQAGTQITDCKEVLDQAGQGLTPYFLAGLQILGKQAYVTRPDAPDVLLCTIDKDGIFTDCDQTGPDEQAFTSLYASGDKMYLSGDDGVTVCSIEANGELSGCKMAYDSEMQSTPGTAIQGSNAYITSTETDTVLLCSVKSDGTFTGCESTGLQGDFVSPEFIIIQGSTAFVTNQGFNFVTLCPILESGELAGCQKVFFNAINAITAIAV
ncbi:hypothetical protein M9434_000679 [Picochlorum sp. BPE23]|nr:hypothetical protein M9434_000679 [Picochlorum sp. BPE23]